MAPARREDPQDRFWRYVDVRTSKLGCWLWMGSKNVDGYGAFWGGMERKTVRAHAFAWELEHGPVPEGMVLMHSCDERACVNPVHLRVGTPAQNAEDRDRKGRAGDPRTWLPPEQLEALRAALKAGEPVIALARKFGVSRTNVHLMRKRLRALGFPCVK
jgi:hypothetical protein